MYLCQHRMYDASAGRWLNRDPVGLAGGMNLYGYCGAGPVRSADPSGLILETIWDATNLYLDAQNLGDSVGRGDTVGAVVDGLAMVGDLAATVLPGVPGGLGTLRKGVKAAQAAEEAIESVRLTKSLRKNLQRAGNVLCSTDDAAHIVAKNDRRAELARAKLAELGMDINDPLNGVVSPRSTHQRSHTNDWYDRVNKAVSEANSIGELADILKKLGEPLRRLHIGP